MSDYRIDRLNHREFEHLIQSLCKNVIAVGMTPFGDGRDGGREATFEGVTKYPSSNVPWSGYTVVQCKFRQRSTGDAESDADWAVRELKKELSNFTDAAPLDSTNIPAGKLIKKPINYLFVTNAVLSPVQEIGGRDRCMKLLLAEGKRTGIKNVDIWGFDDLCRYLDINYEIRRAYSGFLLPDDVLHEAISLLKIDEPDFDKVLAKFLQKEVKADAAAKLQSAGQHDDRHEILLSNVFVDIPFNFEKNSALNPSDDHAELIDFLVNEGDKILTLTERSETKVEERMRNDRSGRFAIVGGPGQGKSTVGQYLCQLYRAEIIKTIPHGIETSVKAIVRSIERNSDGTCRKMPSCRRFPFRIVLNSFATDLANDTTLSVMEYVRRRLVKLGSVSNLSLNHVQRWVAGYPWLFVLDGLDEVPAGSNRKEVLAAVEEFLIDIAANEADVLVIATTRPQGYSDDLANSLFKHLYLAPLSAVQALTYGAALLRCRAADDEDRYERATRRLEMAVRTETTLKLMRSPLQVTIMATLVERLGDPPKQRYRLFAEYYRTIYEREVSREGALSGMLNERKTDIDLIHHRTGFMLQAASENAGDTNAVFTTEDFLSLVRYRLIEELEEPQQKADNLIAEIRQAALDRLVFLVSPQNDHIGFEIRSLQEFMAAEAICKADSLDLIVKRINEIAPIDHWRNVLLFLIGKGFAEDNNPILDRILVLCEELNDDLPGRNAVKWGSRVALETLVEGVARNNPKRERRFCQTALEILDSGGDDYAAELISVYHTNLGDLYRRKLEVILSSPDKYRSLGAWKTLQGIAIQGVNWAWELFLEKWKELSSAAHLSAASTQAVGVSSALLKLLLDDLPKITPYDAFDVFRDRRSDADYAEALEASGLPNWALVIAARKRNLWDLNSPPNLHQGFTIGEKDSRASVVGRFNSVVFDNKDFNLNIRDIPFEHPEWAPLVANAKFLISPSKDTLAESLELLADNYPAQQDFVSAAWMAPWPLAFILCIACSADELRTYSSLIRAGEFGDLEQWIEAEQISVSSTDDLEIHVKRLASSNSIFPEIRTNIPFIATNLAFDMDIVAKAHLLRIWNDLDSGIAKSWVAQQLVHSISVRFQRRGEPWPSLKMTPADAVLLLIDATHFGTVFDVRFFDNVEFNVSEFEAATSLYSDLAESSLRFYMGTDGEASWLPRQLSLLVDKIGITQQTVRWAIWLAQFGGFPSFNQGQRDYASNMGFVADFDKFWLSVGSSDLSVTEALSAFKKYFVDPDTKNDKSGGYILPQLQNAISRLEDDRQLEICLPILEFFHENLTLEQYSSISIGQFAKIVERNLARKKTCFALNKDKLREFQFPLLR